MNILTGIVFLGLAASAAVFLVGWIWLVIQNEREMAALRKQGYTVLPIFPCGHVIRTRHQVPYTHLTSLPDGGHKNE